MKATKKLWDYLEKRKEYRNDTLNFLENELYTYDNNIDILIYLLKNMKLRMLVKVINMIPLLMQKLFLSMMNQN